MADISSTEARGDVPAFDLLVSILLSRPEQCVHVPSECLLRAESIARPIITMAEKRTPAGRVVVIRLVNGHEARLTQCPPVDAPADRLPTRPLGFFRSRKSERKTR